jgi:serine/threonine protein kinase
MGSYPDEQFESIRHRVLIKELFPFHPKGRIFREAKGDICWTEDAGFIMELQRLSFNRGNEVHLKLLEEYPEKMETNINTFSLHNTLYSVLGFSGGRSLDKELEKQKEADRSLAVHVRRILGVLDVLEAFHNLGFLHLDISPDNILLIGEGRKERISLIDYNSVHTIQEIRQGKSVYYSVKEGFTAPEIRSGKIAAIGCSSDLYALTAVFYRLLAGQNLSVLQMVRGRIPDVSAASCLTTMPDTVCSMVRKILRRGLAAVASRRYQTAEQMRQDMEELQDRIEGKGITHPALWETGRNNMIRAVSSNPALSYIREDEKLFPVIGENAQGKAVPLDALIKEVVSPEGSSVFLLGDGGAGKTTALMRTAYLQPAKYSGIEPAFTYLSLYGCSENNPSYLKDMLLESLKFKPGTQNIEMARHELLQLLADPMQTRLGERPKLVILLDGLNESSGETKGLLQEISELSQMQGVRIIMTSRIDVEEIPFPKIKLRPLEKSEVQKILGENGVLMPQQEALVELLRSPMMLSIYIRTALNQGKQLLIRSKEQLLERYFDALLGKEIKRLPDHSKERWQIEAALSFVLPELARLMNAKGHALSDQEMFPALEKCYRRMKKRRMTKVFPKWIGHIADIRGETPGAEAWYGLMVHKILWRRLGLIVRDEQGKYRTSHQMIEEYLIGIQKSFDKRFVREERIKAFLIAVFLMLCPVGAYRAYLPYAEPTQYDKGVSENVLDAAFAAYISCAGQYEAFSDLTACLKDEAVNKAEYDRAVYHCRKALETDSAIGVFQAAGYLDTLYEGGEVMPWSGQSLDEEAYLALIALPADRAKEYTEYLNVLIRAKEDDAAWEYFGEEYMEKLETFLAADAMLLGKYYNMVIEPELTAMEQSDLEEERQNYTRYMKNRAFVAKQNEITAKAEEPAKNLEDYKTAQRKALGEFRENGLIDLFKISEEE